MQFSRARLSTASTIHHSTPRTEAHVLKNNGSIQAAARPTSSRWTATR
jgi:hypothetical protein